MGLPLFFHGKMLPFRLNIDASMSSTPTISIIIPVYKVEDCLRRCLDSVLGQTFTNWECLLVDDGSPDASGLICDEYGKKDSRFHVFHQPHRGVSAARNKGIDEAKGEYITFCDSDDALEDNFLQTFVDLHMKFGADLYVTCCYVIDRDKTFRFLDERKYGKEEIYKFVINTRNADLLGLPWNKMYSAKIIKENGLYFDENHSSYEDEMFVMSYVNNISAAVTSPTITYNKYSRPGSLSRSGTIADKRLFIADYIYDYGMRLSSSKENIEYVKDNYGKFIARGIYLLYKHRAPFKERHRYIVEMKKDAEKKQCTAQLKKHLRTDFHIISTNTFLLEINGFAISLYFLRYVLSIPVALSSF